MSGKLWLALSKRAGIATGEALRWNVLHAVEDAFECRRSKVVGSVYLQATKGVQGFTPVAAF